MFISDKTNNTQTYFTYIKYLYGMLLIFVRSCSVRVVFDYRLDDRGSIPEEGKGFSSRHCFQTSSEALPDSCPMGTGVVSPGVNGGGA
jgi:hypothetical protein